MTALAGHNNPPEPTPYEEVKATVEKYYSEAELWLDGATVDSQELADGISDLLNLLRSARKEADDERKAENKPFDDGKKEVQARYNALFKLVDTATDACKHALQPWLERQAEEKRAREEEARRIADEARRKAEEAARNADRTNLAERQEAERQIEAAKQAEIAARVAEKDTAKSGTVGRSVSLRTSWVAEMTDGVEAARHYWKAERDQMVGFLETLAKQDVARGKRTIPGFNIVEKRTVV